MLDLTTYAPLANSPCIGAGQNVGVTYDYNGNLFRSSNPSVGAIEANPMPFPAPTSGGSSNTSGTIDTNRLINSDQLIQAG